MAFPNTFHGDKFQVLFSNIPTLPSTKDIRIYESFVKTVLIPDYNLEEIYSDIMGFRIRHPDGGFKANYNLSNLLVEFKVSEDMLNYIYLFEWMRSMKYGEVNHFENAKETFRKNGIDSLVVSILDNQKREIAQWRFTNCFIVSLSSLQLEMGVSEEVTFGVNFSYEEIKYTIKDVGD